MDPRRKMLINHGEQLMKIKKDAVDIPSVPRGYNAFIAFRDHFRSIVFLILYALFFISAFAAAGQAMVGGSVQELFGKEERTERLDFSERFRQKKSNTCGPSVLRVALHYLGLDVAEEELSHLAGTGKDGTTMYGLAQAAQRMGLDATGEEWNFARIAEINQPVIAHINNSHYVLVERVVNGHVWLFDPNYGRVSVKTHEFARLWRGVVLVLRTRPLERR